MYLRSTNTDPSRLCSRGHVSPDPHVTAFSRHFSFEDGIYSKPTFSTPRESGWNPPPSFCACPTALCFAMTLTAPAAWCSSWVRTVLSLRPHPGIAGIGFQPTTRPSSPRAAAQASAWRWPRGWVAGGHRGRGGCTVQPWGVPSDGAGCTGAARDVGAVGPKQTLKERLLPIRRGV